MMVDYTLILRTCVRSVVLSALLIAALMTTTVAAAPDANPTVAGCKALVDQKKFSEAAAECTSVLAKDPRQREAYRLRAIANRNMKQYDASISDFTKALEIDPQGYELYGGRAITNRSMKRYPAAVEDMTKALRLAPQKELGSLNLLLGNILYDAEDYPGSLDACLKAKQAAPTPENQNCVGRAYLKLGQYEKALQEYDRIIAADTTLLYAYQNRALAHLELGNADEARKDFDKVFEMRPDLKNFKGVQKNLARLDQLLKKSPAAAAAPAAAPVAGMVLIPAGSFRMGDAIDGLFDASPVHTVTVSAFYLDKYEVTKALWDEVYAWATAHGYTFDNAGAGTATNHPVTDISWYDAVKWLNARSEKEGRQPVYYTDAGQKAIYRTGQGYVINGTVKWTANGYRLPTEAEWEYAARGGTTTRFYTGGCISSDQANYNGVAPEHGGCPSSQARHKTTAVGSFAANPWDLFDMAGNVSEWTWDWSTSSYSSSAVTNPRGPDSGYLHRSIRGGGWIGTASAQRSANRSGNDPSGRSNFIGFRSALSKAQPRPLPSTTVKSSTPAAPIPAQAERPAETAPQPVPAGIDVYELFNADVLAGGRPGGEVLATKALMRLVVGPLDAEQEKQFNAQYAADYAAPTAKVAARHKKLNKSLIDVIVERELMLRSLREYDASMEEARIAGELGDKDAKEEALQIAGINDRMIQDWARSIEKTAAEAAKQDAAEEAALPDIKGSKEYRDNLKAVSEAAKQTDNEPTAPDYAGKWVLYKTETEEAKDHWDPGWFPKHSSSVAATNAKLEYTYLDHGRDGRHRAEEELHVTLQYSWDPAQEALAESSYSEATAADPRSYLWVKGRIENSGTTFSPADYQEKPYAPYQHTRAEIRVWSWQIDAVSGKVLIGSPVKKTSGSFTTELNKDPQKSMKEGVFEIAFEVPMGSRNPGEEKRNILIQINLDDFNGKWATVKHYYQWEVTSTVPVQAVARDVAIDQSLDAEKKEAIEEHLTNIRYAGKAIEGYRRDLATAKDPGAADRIRFNIVHLDQDIHDSKDLIESIKTGQIVHTRGPWEQHAEAVAAQKSRELAETARRGQQMQASALKMAKVLGQYSPGGAKKAHDLILTQISTGLYEKGGMEKAQKALADIYRLTNAGCKKAQAERVEDQEIAEEAAERANRNLEYVETIKKSADTAIFVGTMLTPMGPGALISIAYEGATVGVETGPLDAMKVMAKEAAAMAAMTGAMKGGQALLKKFLNPKVASNVQEAFAAAKFQEEMKFNQALVARVKETQAAVNGAHKAGATAEAIAMHEAAAVEAVSAANSSTLAKRIIKNELNQAQEAFDAAKKKVMEAAKNSEAAQAAKNALAEAGENLREQKGLHLGFQTSLDWITTRVDSKMVARLRSQGYNVEPGWFKDFRNATSVGVNGDRDLGLLRQFETKLMRTNPATGQKTPVFSLEGFMKDAQKEYEAAFKTFNNGRSAKLADQNITTSWHSEAFPLDFLDSEKVGTASSDACRRAGQTIYNKVANALAGSDPEFVNLQKAYASLSKDLKTKVLPTLGAAKPTDVLSGGTLEKAQAHWDEVAHVMDDFAKGRIDPIDATQKMRTLTGGKTVLQVAEDVKRLMQGEVGKMGK